MRCANVAGSNMPPCGMMVGAMAITCGETLYGTCDVEFEAFQGAVLKAFIGLVVTIVIGIAIDVPMGVVIDEFEVCNNGELEKEGPMAAVVIFEVTAVVWRGTLHTVVGNASPKVRGGVEPTSCGVNVVVVVLCSNCCIRVFNALTLATICPIIACIRVPGAGGATAVAVNAATVDATELA